MRKIDLPKPETIAKLSKVSTQKSVASKVEKKPIKPIDWDKTGTRVQFIIPVELLEMILEHRRANDLRNIQEAFRSVLAKGVGVEYRPKGASKRTPTETDHVTMLRNEIQDRFALGEKMSFIAESLGISLSYASMLSNWRR